MKKLKRFLSPFLLYSLLLLPFSVSPCFSEVRLTDEEAQEMLQEMEESKKELETVQTQLQELQTISEEQKKSYEEQLSEQRKKNEVANICAGVGGGATAGLLVAIILILLL